MEKLTKNVTEAHLKEIFSTYGSIVDLDMPLNRACKFSTQSISTKTMLTPYKFKQIEGQHTSSTGPKPTPKQPLHTCTNRKSMEP